MNTYQELINIYSLNRENALRVLDSQQQHIGYQNGINKVTDITYIGDGTNDVELTCTECGLITHQLINKAKWYKIHKTCKCQKHKREIEIKNSRKTKRALKIKQAETYLGKIYGDYEIIDIDTFEAKCILCISFVICLI